MGKIRMKRDNCVLVAIDYQERLVPAMAGKEELLEASARLIKGFDILGLPVVITQQYPKGLGPTVPSIAEQCPTTSVIDKTAFSAWKEPAFVEKMKELDRKVAVVIGIEAHVCEQQTVLDLLEEGYAVVVAADCVASRKKEDRAVSLDCMRDAGAVVTSYEAILFELLETSKAAEFKAISNLVK